MNRAPFGWTKSFNIKVKGHPLAENARTFQKKETAKAIRNRPPSQSH